MRLTFVIVDDDGAKENLTTVHCDAVPYLGQELEFADFEKQATVNYTVKDVEWRLSKYPTNCKLAVFVFLREKYCQGNDQAGGRAGGGR